MAAPESHYGLEVQQTSVQKQTHLLCPLLILFSLETIYCFCCHRIIIQHIPLGHHSMREKELSNILIAPTFNQLQWMSTISSCCINLEHICYWYSRKTTSHFEMVWLNTAKDCKGTLWARLQEIGTNWNQWTNNACESINRVLKQRQQSRWHMLPDRVEKPRRCAVW